MRVVFDTNVVLDVLWSRGTHAAAATALLDCVARKELDAVLCATSLTTIFYLAEKASSAGEARRHISGLLELFDVAAVTRGVLQDAVDLKFDDYEDAVLHEAARNAGAVAIVTRDPKGFSGAKLRLYQPGELLNVLGAAGP